MTRVEIAVMGPDGAVNIIHRKALAEAEDPEARRAELVEDYRSTFANPFRAAELGYIDEVILPEQTRHRLCLALDLMEGKRAHRPPKKHGNIPL